MARTLEEWLPDAQAANPGASTEALTEFYQQKYGPAPASLPTLQSWLPRAQAANPGASEAELTDFWKTKYGSHGAKEKESTEGDWMRGLKTGMETLPEAGYGAVAGLGAVAESVVGEGGLATGVKQWGLKGQEEHAKNIAERSKPTDSLTYSYERAKEGDIGALADWLQYGVGYWTSQLVQGGGTMALGRVAGRLGFDAAKATVGTVATSMAEKLVAKETTRLAATDAGKAMTASELHRAATANVTGRIGELTALATTATGQEGGEIMGDLAAQATREGRTLSGEEIARGLGTSLFAGGLEFVGDKLGLDLVLGKSKLGTNTLPGLPGKASRAVVGGVSGAMGEGATEFAQTLVEEVGKGNDPFADKSIREAIDAMALGGVGGTTSGVVGGLLSQPAKPEPPAAAVPAKAADIAEIPDQVGVNQPLVSVDQAIKTAFDTLGEAPVGKDRAKNRQLVENLVARERAAAGELLSAADAARIADTLPGRRADIPILPGPAPTPAATSPIVPATTFTPRQAPEPDPLDTIKAERTGLLAQPRTPPTTPPGGPPPAAPTAPTDEAPLRTAAELAYPPEERDRMPTAQDLLLRQKRTPPRPAQTPTIIEGTPPPQSTSPIIPGSSFTPRTEPDLTPQERLAAERAKLVAMRATQPPKATPPPESTPPPAATPPAPATPLPTALEAAGTTVQKLHELARAKGLEPDSAVFRELTKMVTGKSHLDDLTPQQREQMAAKLTKLKGPDKPVIVKPNGKPATPEPTQTTAPLVDPHGDPITAPRSALPDAQNMDMLLRAEKAKADLEIAGKERGGRFFIEQHGQGSTPEVRGLVSPTADWYKDLTSGKNPEIKSTLKNTNGKKTGKTAQQIITEAVEKIIRDEGADVGTAVEKVKAALLKDSEFDKTPWGEDASAIMRGEWPSWIPRPNTPSQAGDMPTVAPASPSNQHEATTQPPPSPGTAPTDSRAHEAAPSPQNDRPEPTDGQKEAGNYKKGHVRIAGLNISIENPEGSTRSGVSSDGTKWSNKMVDHYGYIRGTKGKDKEHLDLFIKPGTPGDYNGPVFVVDQKKKGGQFDEHKVIFGVDTVEAAREVYKRNYSADWDGILGIKAFTMPEFKAWLEMGDTTKPVAGREERLVEQKAKLAKPVAPEPAKPTSVETIDVSKDTPVGENAAGEKLYERADGTRYRMRTDRKDRPHGYPDFGGDLAPTGEPFALTAPSTPKPKKTEPKTEQLSIDVPPPTTGEKPIIGREVTPEEAPLFSKAAQTPDAEQAELPTGKEPWQMTRDEYVESVKPNVLPPEYATLDAIAKQANRAGYDPDAITPERVDALKSAELISGTKHYKLTEKGRAKLHEWKDAERENDLKAGDAFDQHIELVDQAIKAGKPVPKPVRDAYGDLLPLKGATTDPQAIVSNAIAGALRQAATQIEQATKPEKPAKPVKPREDSLTDVGEELWYNKRNRLSNGVKWDDVKDLNDTLKTKEVTKTKVWPRPDYEQLVKDGMHPFTAHMVKQMYDAIATAPDTRSAPTDEELQTYIETVQKLREEIFAWAKDVNAQKSMVEQMVQQGEQTYGYGQRTSLTSLLQAGRTTALHQRIWHKDPETRRWVDDQGRASVGLVGGNKLFSALQPGFEEARRATRALGEGWPAAQEAWQKQFEIKLSPKGDTIWEKSGKRTLEADEYWIVRKSKGGYGGRMIMASGFKTREEAVAKAKEMAASNKGGTGQQENPLELTHIKRTGPDHRRPGQNITPQELKDAFGFRGVNFGNWTNQAERQAHVNHAYDSFLDLAGLLNVPPKALSLNGLLGVAFGAQGGGSAAAHFVPGVNEINLTKTQGAGSLAHEWFHAVDHYFAVQAGHARGDEPYLTHLVDGSSLARGEIRPEIVDAMKTIVKTMKRRDATPEEIAADLTEKQAKNLKGLSSWLTAIGKRIPEDKRGPYNTLAEKIKLGDVGEGYIPLGGLTSHSAIYPRVKELRDAYKAAMGHAFSADEAKAIQSWASSLVYGRKTKAEDVKHIPQRATSYYQKAEELDKDKKGKVYWTQPTELGARAFQSYVMDRLADQTRRNDYLTRPQGGEPERYPHGEERTRINAAFDTLINELKTKETDQGIAVYEEGMTAARPLSDDVQLLVDEPFDLKQIGNRRFMYNPKTRELILGREFGDSRFLVSSHAEEHKKSRAKGKFDDFVRGWVGTSADEYPHGVVHFAPPVYAPNFRNDPDYADDILRTLQVFAQNGATKRTVLRNVLGYGDRPWGKTEFKRLLGAQGSLFEDDETATAPTFFSRALQVLEEKMPNRASADQLRGILSPANSVKPEELRWLSFDEFLKTKPTFTKEEVLDYVRAHEVHIEEVVKVGPTDEEIDTFMEDEAGEGFDDRDEAADYLNQEENRPKFSAYQLGGEKEDYRELLLTLPVKRSKFATKPDLTGYRVEIDRDNGYQMDYTIYDQEGEWVSKRSGAPSGLSHEQILHEYAVDQQLRETKQADKAKVFTSSHFDEKNILVHVRFNDRFLHVDDAPRKRVVRKVGDGPWAWKVFIEGEAQHQLSHQTEADALKDVEIEPTYTGRSTKKVLFLEEVQSDWHQTGRSKGYMVEKPTLEDAKQFFGIRDADWAKMDAEQRHSYLDEMTSGDPHVTRGTVPDAPFKKTWHELALKRMLRYAAEHGYDYMAWTTGEQQAERYDLSKQVQSIEWNALSTKTPNTHVNINLISGGTVTFNVDENGTVLESITDRRAREFVGKHLSDVVGKEVAEKIMGNYKGELKEEGLRIGGEGMRGFYDKMVPEFLSKYVKKWGAKVGTLNIKADNAPEHVVEFWARSAEGENHPLVKRNRMPVHALPITAAMRKSVLTQGQALFENRKRHDLRPGENAQLNFDFGTAALADLEKAGKNLDTRGELGGVRDATAKTVAVGISPDLIHQGVVDLTGYTVRSAEDLAKLAQVYRDPRFETFRVFYLKGDTIVGHEGFTSRLPGTVQLFPTLAARNKTMARMKATMQKNGADGYYLLHNHPSGNSKPSIGDVDCTRVFVDAIPSFRGHVVIDSNEYSTLDRRGWRKTHKFNFGPDKLLTPSQPHPLLGREVPDFDELVKLGKELQSPTGYATLFYMSSAGQVRAIQEVPLTLLADVQKATAYIGEQGVNFGARNIYAYAKDDPAQKDFFDELRAKTHMLIKNNVLTVYTHDMGEQYRYVYEPVRSRPYMTLGKDMRGALPMSVDEPVYHGTPHLWQPEPGFPHGRPRLDKMGTGEGAQAYGWGWYSAQSKEVAKSYRDNLTSTIPGAHTGGSRFQIKGVPFPRGRSGHAALDTANEIEMILGTTKDMPNSEMLSYVKRNVEQRIARWKDSGTKTGSAGEDMQALVDFYEQHVKNVKPEQIVFEDGSLYELDMPDAVIPTLLQWDKSLGNQTPAVQEKLQAAGLMPKQEEVDAAWKAYNDAYQRFETLMDGARYIANAGVDQFEREDQREAFQAVERTHRMWDDMTEWLNMSARTMYQQLALDLRTKPLTSPDDKAAAERLRELGIPGSRYLDGNSRYADAEDKPPTYNYVIWDQATLDKVALLKRNEKKLDALRERAEANEAMAVNEDNLFTAQPPRRPATLTGMQQSLISSQGALAYELPAMHWWDDTIRTMQDKNIDLVRLVETIKATGRTVADDLNPVLKEELYLGRVAKRTEDFMTDELRPLVDAMRLNKVTMAELDRYLHARHAEEANNALRAINPDREDNDALSGMTTDEARRILAEADRPKMDRLAAKVDAILAKTRQLLVAYGLESQETVNRWQEEFSAYVPLHREPYEEGTPGTGQGRSVRGPHARSRTGSNLKVTNILANIALDREKAIVRGEKMRPVIALAGLLQQYPNDDIATLTKPAAITYRNPDTGLLEQVPGDTGEYRVPMLKSVNRKTGEVEWRPDPTYKGRDNVVNFRLKGVDHAIVFNESNPRAVQMARALKDLDVGQLNTLLASIAPATRFLASINTQYNPVFGVINFIRDIQFAMLALGTTPLAGKRSEIRNATFKAIRGIYQDARAVRRGEHPTSPVAQLWERFQRVGGPTGYRDLFKGSKDRANAIQRMLEPAWWEKGKGGAAFTFLKEWVSDYNQAMENAVRLGVFQVGLAEGLSDEQAASYAKNITVNFNKKGTVTTQVGALYAFFNASVQGTARIAETLFQKGKLGALSVLGKNIVRGGLMAGVLQAFALSMAGFDDDDPPEWLKSRSLILPVPGTDKGYVSIPMPLGFNILPNFGRLAAEGVLHGKPIDRAYKFISTFIDSFSPVGGAASVSQLLAPTAVDPFVALSENKDWTGRRIYREDMNSLKPTPGVHRAKEGASWWATGLAEAINWATGGTDYTPGHISPTPDALDYLVEQMTGGVGREIGKAADLGSALYDGDEIPLHKVPLLGRLAGSASGTPATRHEFFDHIREVNVAHEELIGRRKHGGDVTGYLEEHPEARLYQAANQAERQVHDLQKRRREWAAKGATHEQLRLLDMQIAARMDRFNQQFKTAAVAQ